MYEVAVVGGGIIGAPAARLLAERGRRLALIAAPEPTDARSHNGVFGAHYDVSRLSWKNHPDPIEALLTHRSVEDMTRLHERAGDILRRGEFLFAFAPGLDEGMAEVLEGQVGTRALSSVELRRSYPSLAFPSDVIGFVDPAGPGILNPRNLVAAEVSMARHAGAELIQQEAARIEVGSPMRVHLADGSQIEAERVLAATGAFSNRPGLLPRPLALRLKEESVIVAELAPDEARRLSSLPAMSYNLAAETIGEVYAAPPVRYPDGRFGLKWGANTIADRWVGSFDAISAWYREGAVSAGELIRPYVEEHIPSLRAQSWNTHRCVVTYTAGGNPYIDAVVDDRLYVAIGGNGRAAKTSTALGGLAAGLVEGRWDDEVPHAPFAVRFDDEETSWTSRDLWATRRAN